MLRPQGRRRFRLGTSGHARFPVHGAAVQNAELGSEFLAERIGGFRANHGMGVPGQLRSGGFSGADGPDRLVSDDQVSRFLGRNFVERAETLASQNVVGQSGFAFFEDLAHADDGDESAFKSRFELEIDGVIGLAEVLAPLGVADDDVGCADAPTCWRRSRR